MVRSAHHLNCDGMMIAAAVCSLNSLLDVNHFDLERLLKIFVDFFILIFVTCEPLCPPVNNIGREVVH